MAQYVPYIPEILPETPLYTPDMNFFDHMMQRKQSMFEQGLSKARTAYTSVLNAPLSNKENIPIKDQFVKDAKEALKSLSSADLSLPQNVAAAENIFSPFWEDKFIMQDANLTNWYQNQQQTMQSWKYSTDPKVREQYSGIGEMYLQNGFENLVNAKRTAEDFSLLQKRQATPFTNLENYLQDQAKDQGLTLKYDDPNGIYMVETQNGKKSQRSYAAWANAILGNNFYEQFRVTGKVENEQRLKILRQQFPNASEQELQGMVANSVVTELRDGYTKRKTEINTEIAKIDSVLTDLAKSNSPQNQSIVENLVQQRREFLADMTGIDADYKYFDEQDKNKIKEAVSYNPDSYFATLAKQRTVNNWATGRASMEARKITENTAFSNAQDRELTRRSQEITAQKNTWDRDQDLWERAHPKQGKGSGKDGGNGDGSEPTDVGVDTDNALVYRGLSGIDITKNGATALERFNSIQSQNFNEAFNLIFDQKGILGFAKNLGLSEEELSHVVTGMRAEMKDLNYTFSKEQNKAIGKLDAALNADAGVKAAGVGVIKGPYNRRNALIAYAQQYLKDKNTLNSDGASIPLSKEEHEGLLRYAAAVRKLDTYNSNEQRRDELLKKNIIGNKKYEKFVVDRNGKKDMVSISDVEHLFKDATFDGPDGNPVKFSANQIAKAYFDGNITKYIPTGMATFANSQQAQGGNITYGYTITIDKNKYNLTGTVNAYGNLVGETGNQVPEALVKLDKGVKELDQRYYGSSQEFASKFKAAQESIVPDLLMYKNQSGRQGAAFTMYFNAKKSIGEGDKAAQIVDQALNMANADIYDTDGQPVDTETMQTIRTLLKTEKNMEDLIGAEYIPQGVNGQRTVRVFFSKPISDDTKTSALATVANKTFNLVIKDGATAPALDELPNSTGYQIYDLITKGKVFKSDPVIESSGFKFVVTPNVLASEGQNFDVSPEYVTVDVSYFERVNEKDNNGQLITTLKPNSSSVKIPLIGSSAKSPDEVVNKLYSLYQEVMYKNKQLHDQYEESLKYSNNGINGVKPFNTQEYLKQNGLGGLIK